MTGAPSDPPRDPDPLEPGLLRRGASRRRRSSESRSNRSRGFDACFVRITVELPEDVLIRLQSEATRRGVSIDVVITELATALPDDHVPVEQGPSFIGLGASSSGGSARDADELLADGFGRA